MGDKKKKKKKKEPWGHEPTITLDHTKHDPMEEQFMQRNKLFPTMINRVGNKLKDFNKKHTTLRSSRNSENPLKSKHKLYQKN